MSTQAQSSTDVRVPIQSMLRSATYRRLAAFATQHHVTVGQVLAELADRAIQPPSRKSQGNGRKPQVRMNPERLNRLVLLRQAGHAWASIAIELDVSLASVHAHGKKLGL